MLVLTLERFRGSHILYVWQIGDILGWVGCVDPPLLPLGKAGHKNLGQLYMDENEFIVLTSGNVSQLEICSPECKYSSEQ